MYARIDIECLAGRFGILPIIVIKLVLNNGRYTPNFTIVMHETRKQASKQTTKRCSIFPSTFFLSG